MTGLTGHYTVPLGDRHDGIQVWYVHKAKYLKYHILTGTLMWPWQHVLWNRWQIYRFK